MQRSVSMVGTALATYVRPDGSPWHTQALVARPLVLTTVKSGVPCIVVFHTPPSSSVARVLQRYTCATP